MAEDNAEEIMIRGFKNNFLMRTGKNIKISTCSTWEGAANFTYNITIDEVILMVTAKTGWTHAKIYDGYRTEEVLYRRGLIDYIAINNGETLINCALHGIRHHTTVIHSLKKFEERLETEGYVRQAFSEIINFCRDNYYLYRGKTLSGQ
jgi:chromosomal replication initiation ATPase DnaA